MTARSTAPATEPAERDDGPAPELPAHGMRSPGSLAMIALMALGSILMWVASPVAWLFLASRMTSSSQPSIGPYLLVLVGIVITAVVVGKALGALNRTHMRYTGLDKGRHHHRSWNRSMRDARQSSRERGVLEPVMAWSVGFAMLAFLVWFFGFAGSSIG